MGPNVVSGTSLLRLKSELIQHLQGPLEITALGARSPGFATADHLVFVSHPEQYAEALGRGVRFFVVLESLLKKIQLTDSATLVFKTPRINLAMALVLPLFDRKLQRFDYGMPIHPTAVVHPSAIIGPGVVLGPHAFVGARAVIAEECRIGAGTTVENDAHIGKHTILHPQVFIGAHCMVGSFCEIHPHTTIGSDGFGFASDADFKHHKIPQLGRVIIEDHVEIGANCAIDRATLDETRIKSGTKFDNLCHVAHNCEIGSDSLIAGGFFIAGSSKIGNRFMTGGNTVVADHVEITEGVIVAGLSGVTSDVRASGAYGGYPLQPMKDSLKTLTTSTNLYEMRKQIHRILKFLKLDKES